MGYSKKKIYQILYFDMRYLYIYICRYLLYVIFFKNNYYYWYEKGLNLKYF